MNEKISQFYGCLLNLYSDILRTRTKTISTQEFKERLMNIYGTWKIEIKPMLTAAKLGQDILDMLDIYFENVYYYSKAMTSQVSELKTDVGKINDLFLKHIVAENHGKSEETFELNESASFLGLDANWFSATCALQLQEVAITLVAKQKNIQLDKKHVERILERKIDYLSFNDQYEAFSKEIKRLYDVDMPFLTTQFRRIRVKILHEGYNPEPEEKNSIVSFTLGLLQKLKDISDKEPFESKLQ